MTRPHEALAIVGDRVRDLLVELDAWYPAPSRADLAAHRVAVLELFAVVAELGLEVRDDAYRRAGGLVGAAPPGVT